MSDRIGDWICVASGDSFYPIDPRPADFRIEDIAHALSHLCRFGGHCRVFYSVAEHSVRAFQEARRRGASREVQRAVLMHDASEAYLVDVPRPIKRYLPTYREIEHNLSATLGTRFQFNPAEPLIKVLDEVMLATEKRDLMPATSLAWAPLPEPLPKVLKPMSPRRAKIAFLVAWAICGHEIE